MNEWASEWIAKGHVLILNLFENPGGSMTPSPSPLLYMFGQNARQFKVVRNTFPFSITTELYEKFTRL